jgi:hypothetical protein
VDERKRQGVSASKAASAAPRPETRRGRRSVSASKPATTAGQPLRIIRARRYAVKPMSVDEAALEVADGGDAFLVFRNASTRKSSRSFRRATAILATDRARGVVAICDQRFVICDLSWNRRYESQSPVTEG